MGTLQIVLGIAVLVMALFLIVSILFQSGSNKRLSGTIAGGAETFFGKNKGKTIDRVLGKVTNVVTIVFALAVLACFLFQDFGKDESGTSTDSTTTSPIATTTVAATTSGTALASITSTSGTTATTTTTTAAN